MTIAVVIAIKAIANYKCDGHIFISFINNLIVILDVHYAKLWIGQFQLEF